MREKVVLSALDFQLSIGQEKEIYEVKVKKRRSRHASHRLDGKIFNPSSRVIDCVTTIAFSW